MRQLRVKNSKILVYCFEQLKDEKIKPEQWLRVSGPTGPPEQCRGGGGLLNHKTFFFLSDFQVKPEFYVSLSIKYHILFPNNLTHKTKYVL